MICGFWVKRLNLPLLNVNEDERLSDFCSLFLCFWLLLLLLMSTNSLIQPFISPFDHPPLPPPPAPPAPPPCPSLWKPSPLCEWAPLGTVGAVFTEMFCLCVSVSLYTVKCDLLHYSSDSTNLFREVWLSSVALLTLLTGCYPAIVGVKTKNIFLMKHI